MHPIIQYPFLFGVAALVIVLAQIEAKPQPATKYPTVEPATHKAYAEKINDKVSFDMVPIPGSTFMGQPRQREGPRRQ